MRAERRHGQDDLPSDHGQSGEHHSPQTSPGTITKIELEFDKAARKMGWKIDSQKRTDQHEIVIDARSGTVFSTDRDHEAGAPRAVTPKKLTHNAALTKATKTVPGSVAGVRRRDSAAQRRGAHLGSETRTWPSRSAPAGSPQTINRSAPGEHAGTSRGV